MSYVFVYGSLKMGHWNHHLLDYKPQGSTAFFGDVLTKDKYTLTDCGFPYLVDGGKNVEHVVGELYEVVDKKVFEVLDALEGVAYNHYKRKTIEVYDPGSGEVIEAQTYLVCNKDQALNLPLCPVEEGYGESYYEWKGR